MKAGDELLLREGRGRAWACVGERGLGGELNRVPTQVLKVLKGS